jgi:hypothetical protein
MRVQVSGDTISLYYNDVPTRCGSEAVISPIMGGAVSERRVRGTRLIVSGL